MRYQEGKVQDRVQRSNSDQGPLRSKRGLAEPVRAKPPSAEGQIPTGAQANLNPGQSDTFGVLRRELHNLEQTIDSLYHVTLSAPGDPAWEHVRQLVICLDATAELMRQTLDSAKAEK